jgi:hypothetical protein
MPIKPENRARYPAEWPAIALAARERAGWKCQHEGCGAHQYSVGWWHERWPGFVWVPEWPKDGVFMGQTCADARAVAAGIQDATDGGEKPTVIVLTLAHLDHQPENVADDNLRLLCQRHHLAHDQEHHIQNSRATRRARLAIGDLFE